jgi:hypothetical protein
MFYCVEMKRTSIIAGLFKKHEAKKIASSSTPLFNIIGVSCKRHDMLRDIRAQKVCEALDIYCLLVTIG